MLAYYAVAHALFRSSIASSPLVAATLLSAALSVGLGCGPARSPADDSRPAAAPAVSGSSTLASPPLARMVTAAPIPTQEPPPSLSPPLTSVNRVLPAGELAATRFPPADVAPPHVRTAAPGDGVWQPVVGPLREGQPLMARTRLHGHPIRRDKFIDVVAVDRAYVEPVLVVGSIEPEAPAVPAERRPGLVPVEDHPRLLAVLNGGFMQRHGKWGMRVGEDEFTPPREDGCTIARRRDGTVRIGSHATLALGGDVDWYRQTPPCLVEGGKAHERLTREPGNALWGKAIDGKVDIRRSALALDRSGRVLYYVFSEWNNASELAQALVALGVDVAAELDVNWSYTRFYWFEPGAGATPKVREALVPKLDADPRRYVEKPAERDFFYLRLR
ncbi:MAG: hypothetical protein FJ095_05700 [Deltaproteobacteria bacterium]|nr:hypothetical protein [Deltaproteobacteria bacterium]